MKRIYDKLVRDRIPEIIIDEGNEPVYRVEGNDAMYWDRLISKLHEEVTELGDDKTIEEIADILEVIYAICRFQDIDLREVENIRVHKKFCNGGYDKRYILQTVNDK